MLATARARGYRSASRTVSAGKREHRGPGETRPAWRAAPRRLNAPAIRMSASADEDAIAEIPSAQPVRAGVEAAAAELLVGEDGGQLGAA